MKTLAEQMAVYGAYHQNPWNRFTHFIGVPAIIFAILIPLSWLRFPVVGLELSAAMVLVLFILAYYMRLDRGMALAMLLVLGALLYCGDRVATQFYMATGWIVFAIAFIGGWTLQLLGHVFEGRRPALVDNLWQILIAPIFLVAEVFFMFGARRKLQLEIESRIRSVKSSRGVL